MKKTIFWIVVCVFFLIGYYLVGEVIFSGVLFFLVVIPWIERLFLVIFLSELIMSYKIFLLYCKNELFQFFKNFIFYDPPKDYSPAEISIVAERCLTWDAVFATLCDRENKRYIKTEYRSESGEFPVLIIRKIEKGSFSLFEKELWSFFQLNTNTEWRSDFFQTNQIKYDQFCDILRGQFDRLKYRLFNYRLLPNDEKVPVLIRDRNTNKWSRIFGMFFALLISSYFCFLFIFFAFDKLWIGVLICLTFLVFIGIFIFSSFNKLFPLILNQTGIQVRTHILGFKKYLKSVEQQKLKVLLKQDIVYTDKNLPYVVALGLSDERVEKCYPLLKAICYVPPQRA